MKIDQKIIEDNLGLVGKIVREYTCPNHLEKEDLFQEGVLGLYDAARAYDHTKGVKFSSYAYVCAKNKINNYVRKNKKPIFIEDLVYEPSCVMGNVEESIGLEIAVSSLPNREQKVIKLLFYEQKTLEEVGKQMGISHMTVARVRDKALEKIKKAV